MANYPPPYPPPGAPSGPPYGNDWKYQRRMLKEQMRAQRDMVRAQRDAYRYQARSMRRSSILGPLVLITLGILFLLVQTGRLQAHYLWDWYARFWPFLLVGAGVILLLEWAYDQYAQSDSTHPPYRRRVGGGVVTLLIFLAVTGVIFSGIRSGGSSKLFPDLNLNQDNWDEFMGDKHESDQTIVQAFPAGASLNVDNPRGDVTITGTSDDNQIHVAVHKDVYSRSDSDADSKAQRLTPVININGNTVTLNVPTVESTRADLTITLPANVSPVVNANHGDIKISSIKGPVRVTANHGDVEISAITGDVNARINNGNNDFSAHSVTGQVNLEGRAHDTTFSDLSGPVSVRGDFFGDTHCEHIRGPFRFHTSRTDFQLSRLDGDIEIGNNAELNASNAVGPVTLTTYSRNITLDRIAGDIFVTNRNGSVDVTSAPPLSSVTIENRNGSVSVTVPEDAGFAYQFDANNGDIQSEFNQIRIPDGGMQKKSVSGSVGSGGPLIRITTSQGDVAIKKGSIQPLPPTPPAPPRITLEPPTPPSSPDSVKQAQQNAKEAAAEAKRAAAEAKKATKDAQQPKPDKQ